MKIKVTDYSNGTHEFHAVDCVHQKTIHSSNGDSFFKEFDASNKKELINQIELWFNKDFASSNGMTPEEYIASGDGYECSTESGSDLHLFPCVKFSKEAK
jgi:hypothetical protein